MLQLDFGLIPIGYTIGPGAATAGDPVKNNTSCGGETHLAYSADGVTTIINDPIPRIIDLTVKLVQRINSVAAETASKEIPGTGGPVL